LIGRVVTSGMCHVDLDTRVVAIFLSKGRLVLATRARGWAWLEPIPRDRFRLRHEAIWLQPD
jgi:hypothetical protein